MVDLKAALALLLVAGFHLQLSHSAPVDSPKPPMVPITNTTLNGLYVLAPITTTKQPLVIPAGNISNASSPVSSTTPKPALNSTGSLSAVTSQPGNISGQPVPHNGSANVSGAVLAVTPRAAAAVTGGNPILSGSHGNISTFPINGSTNSQPNVLFGNKPVVVNGAFVNPCPDRCPNGIGGNPPCICEVPRV
ncbi:uncharacterized protein RB166_019524 [Leptodactylus fuscus]